MDNRCSHGTFPHVSLQRSHLNHCYYHQDLHYFCFLRVLRLIIHKYNYLQKHALLHIEIVASNSMAEFRWVVLAPSIFRARSFGRWVVTHSLADFDFHDHRPAVTMNQHLLQYLDERLLWHLISRDRFIPHRQFCLPKMAHLAFPLRRRVQKIK
jgi:hypothetical protein